jgi:hypothetical protein
MLVDPELNEVVNGERGMLRGIEVVLSEQCLVSAVGLMFAAIDALSALTRPIDSADTSRSVFIDWTTRYLEPEKRLACTAEELYAARCGVLHTYSADSRLARTNGTRRLVYEWERGPRADEAAELPDNAIRVRVEALHRALRKAVHQFIIDAEMDPDTKQRVSCHLPSMLCYKPWPRLEVVGVA